MTRFLAMTVTLMSPVLLVLAAFALYNLDAEAVHWGRGGHGIQLDCNPEPYAVEQGQTVTVTYIVRNAAGAPGNLPDHTFSYTLTDQWVGDIVGSSTDTLQYHQTSGPADLETFTEGVDQLTYVRTFTASGSLLDNTVTVAGTFGDGHIARMSMSCNIVAATPAPTPGSCDVPQAGLR